MTDSKKSYYAVIPANVRYDESLPPNAKLLYGEITALCNAEGYCWASNKYFAELYGVTIRTIANWLRSLTDRGYIKAEVFYKQGSKEVEKRFITIIQYPHENNFSTYRENFQYPHENNFSTPHEKNFTDNITSINNTFNNTNEYIDKSDKPPKPPRHKYGLYNNVLLTDDDYAKLTEEYPADYQERIDRLSEYIESKGAKYKNHLATIRAWGRRDKEKASQAKPTEQKSSNPFLKMLEEGAFDE